MTNALWTFADLAAASGGTAEGAPGAAITGFSIDTRCLAPGEVFVALKDQRDGHEFVSTAFENGAAAALVLKDYVRQPGDGTLIRVDDTLKGLESIGRAARARLATEARVIAVTGSVGKTTTKEMLRLACSALGPTHASDKSFNNHWGVPLTLARMPADTHYAIFEIGMNHAGEITPLTGMVRPHVAIVTTVEAAHIEHFGSEEEIADAKAEIFSGLLPGGTAIISLDNRHAARLAAAARATGARVCGVTKDKRLEDVLDAGEADACVALRTCHMTSTVSEVVAERGDSRGPLAFVIGAVGMHMVMNGLIVLAVLDAAGADTASGLAALAGFSPPPGRGSRTSLPAGGGEILLIDESYNANPASMRAALAVLPALPRAHFPRRIAVLGDMLELGSDAPALHADLWQAVDAAGVDLIFCAGPNMARLFERVPAARRGAAADTSRGIEVALLESLKAGDVVMIKGSNGLRMGLLVEAIKAKFARAQKAPVG